MTLTEPSVIFVTPIQLHLLVHTRDPTGLTDNVPSLRLTALLTLHKHCDDCVKYLDST